MQGEVREPHQSILHRDLKHKYKAELKGQLDPEPFISKEVDVTDLACQYTDDIETLRLCLNIPDPRDSVSVSSTSVMSLSKVAEKQELRHKGPIFFQLIPTSRDHQDRVVIKWAEPRLVSGVREGR